MGRYQLAAGLAAALLLVVTRSIASAQGADPKLLEKAKEVHRRIIAFDSTRARANLAHRYLKS